MGFHLYLKIYIGSVVQFLKCTFCNQKEKVMKTFYTVELPKGFAGQIMYGMFIIGLKINIISSTNVFFYEMLGSYPISISSRSVNAIS